MPIKSLIKETISLQGFRIDSVDRFSFGIIKRSKREFYQLINQFLYHLQRQFKSIHLFDYKWPFKKFEWRLNMIPNV
jgi:hypothetical protein